jgi:DNA-binding LacI/PurR family transcriptional regulator
MNVTIKTIAKMAGISPSTVSLVLNGKDERRVGAKTRATILSLVERHGYRQIKQAQGLKLGKTFRVGICFEGGVEQSPIFGHFSAYDMLRVAAQRLRLAGYGVDLLQIDLTPPLPDIVRRLTHEEVDGLLMLDWNPEPLDRILSSMSEQHVPAVSMGTEAAKEFSWAAIDDRVSTEAALDYLWDHGCRCVALVVSGEQYRLNRIKRTAYETYSRKRGLSALPSVVSGSMGLESVSEAIRSALEENPVIDGVLLTDNSMGPAAQAVLQGRDIRLLGYGDACFADMMCRSPYEYMRMPVGAVAEAAVDLLLEHIRSSSAPAQGRRFVCERTQRVEISWP